MMKLEVAKNTLKSIGYCLRLCYLEWTEKNTNKNDLKSNKDSRKLN